MTGELECAVCQHIARRRGELVELLRDLIRFDTTTWTAGALTRDEAALQTYLAERLAAAGASIDLAEPDPALVNGHRMIPDGFTCAGRPQLVARFPGTGAGRTPPLNGHVDVVDARPLADWAHPPFAGTVADGAVHGRGACDMKGGVACMVFAAEALAELEAPLAGDLLLNTVTDEESTGAGGLVGPHTHGRRGDRHRTDRPAGMDRLPRQPARANPHPGTRRTRRAAGAPARRWPSGQRDREAGDRPGRDPPATPALVRAPQSTRICRRPTASRGGARRRVDRLLSVELRTRLPHRVPARAGRRGRLGIVGRRRVRRLDCRHRGRRPVAGHPPAPGRLDARRRPPAEVRSDEPIVQTALASLRSVGLPAHLGGMDNWHDGATLTVEGKIPAVCFGPGDIGLAHTTAESVPIDGLVACAQTLAVTALRHCGPATAR